MQIWIADTGQELRVFDTRAAAQQWAGTRRGKVEIWNMMAD